MVNKSLLCTICLEIIKPENKSKIECCEHLFCYECISDWAVKSKETIVRRSQSTLPCCPNCKKDFCTIKNVYDKKVIMVADIPVKPLIFPKKDGSNSSMPVST